jgi:peptide/nickel transport system substrate-binding protein
LRIQRLREIRLAHGQAAVTALRRGDVTMIDHIPPDQVASLAEVPGIQVGKYTQPRVHVIALDGRNPMLRSRALRRGLSYAVDRKSLLEDTLLKHPLTDGDTPADGPFPKGNYADAPGVKPLGFNPGLATMLIAAAQKEIGLGPIKLNLEYPALPEVRAAVAKLAEAFQRIRVEIHTIELPESRLENELRAGRRFDLAYRVLQCDDPVLDAGPFLCPGYDAPPETNNLTSAVSPRILQLLLQLERASDWPSARGLAIQIDRESRDELPVIPLWQVVDHYAWRDRLKGPANGAAHLYQGIESWEIAPWIARDPWDVPVKASSK